MQSILKFTYFDTGNTCRSKPHNNVDPMSCIICVYYTMGDIKSGLNCILQSIIHITVTEIVHLTSII